MALFDSGPKKILKRIRKYAGEGSINKVSSTVKEEKASLLEESTVALELVELLLDIGHPNLAANVGEEVMRRHRQIARDVRDLFIGRLNEFSRSTDLLRVTWKSFIDMHDYRGALSVLREAEEITVSNLFDIIRDKKQNSMRFDGTVHPEADQSALVEWALHLYRERRAGEAIDFLWKVCRDIEYPQREISMLAFWIGNEVRELDSSYWVSLMGIAAVTGKMNQALQFANKLTASEPTPDEATEAANVIEKYMLAADRSGKSAAILAELYTAAGKTEAATKTLENIYGESLDREELESAIEDLVAHPESGAAPLLLSAQMHLEKGNIEEAKKAVESAFESGDAESEKLVKVCREIIEATENRTGAIARKLARYLVDNGSISEAVLSLVPMVDVDASWVFEQIQRLLARERNNASVLALLAVVLYETGKKEKAAATLEHLSRRTDKQFCSNAASVLDRMDHRVQQNARLLEARALFRYRSERDEDAAEDWFKLLMKGVTPSPDGQKLLTEGGISAGSTDMIEKAGFRPSTPWQAYAVSLICLREGNGEYADRFLREAMKDPELQGSIVRKIDDLPDEIRNRLNIKNILEVVTDNEAARNIADFLDRMKGDEDWKISLATGLKWGNPTEEAEFKLKYLLSSNKVILAGSSYIEGSVEDPVLNTIGRACSGVVQDRFREALNDLQKPVSDPSCSSIARNVLQFLLPKAPALGIEIRKLIAESYKTEKKFDDISSVLGPVLHEEGIMELLEEMTSQFPGEYALTHSLTRAAAERKDFERFHKYSAVLLELDRDVSGELISQAVSMAEEGGSGEAYLYAARISSRYGEGEKVDNYITRAVMLLPELAFRGLLKEFHSLDDIPRAVCQLAEGNAEGFSEVCRKNRSMEIPLNDQLLSGAMEKWKPQQDSEALLILADVALANDFTDQAEDILAGVAVEGPSAWKADASRRLLEAVESEKASRRRFWESVSVDTVIAEALERLLPEDYSSVDREEAKVIAPAVLESGQGIRRLFQLADDDLFFPKEDTHLRRKLAEACLENLEKMDEEEKLNPAEVKKLLNILLSAGMLAEASEIARKEGSNDLLATLRKGLEEARRNLDSQGLDKARALLLTGEPVKALKLLDRLEKSVESIEERFLIVDTRALALWRIGYRQSAVSTWMRCYRDFGKEKTLERLFWALDQSGAQIEKAALRRFAMENHPDMVSMLEGCGSAGWNAERMELISGLGTVSKTEKVKNG